METCPQAGLHEHMCSGSTSGADTGERNTRRSGADTEGTDNYLKVLEALLGRQRLDVAHCGGNETDSRSTREF